MEDAPVVVTRAGAVQGLWRGPSNAAYLGIPFAEPPVGPFRFAAPVPRAPWEGVRPARRYGATPWRDYGPTAAPLKGPAAQAPDDTLLLNVLTPSPNDADARLPVFVWIHGGSFTSGSPSSSWYVKGSFPRDGVVVVSVSYRLGFDGFGSVAGAPSNRALRDWILALEWVQENIASFGGDPSRVTVGGQSAGATAVLTLLATPSAQHLFRAAIAQSPASADGSPATARRRTDALAARLGVASSRDALAAVAPERLVRAQEELDRAGLGLSSLRRSVRGSGSFLLWSPVVDAELLPAPVHEAIASGLSRDVPLLVGANADEFASVGDAAPRILDLVPRRLLLVGAGFGCVAARDYARITPRSTRRVLGSIVTDTTFRFEIARVLRSRAAGAAGAVAASELAGAAELAGAVGAAAAPTHAFDFRWRSRLNGRAGHGLELPFVWDCLDALNVEELNTGANPPQALADVMHDAWVRFISNGTPGWSAASGARPAGMRFDEESREGTVFARELAFVARR